MNTRQSGAHTELIKKEEKARARWDKENRRYQTRQAAAWNEPPAASYSREPEEVYEEKYSNVPYSSYDGMATEVTADPEDVATIYDRANRISSPRLVDDGSDIPTVVERKVVRQVEVPYTRQVKVPIKTRKIVPTKVKKKVKTTKLVEVPSYKMVDETYTEMIQQPAVRQKEIWVKKLVPEKYMETVPIKRTRKVKVPTTVIQEVDDYEVVEVSGSKTVEVDGYRVDDVEDTKVVEVEEYQSYRLKPEATGPARVDKARDIGLGTNEYGSRRIGMQVYHPRDERIRDIPLEDEMRDLSITSHNYRPSTGQRRSRGARPSSAPVTRGYEPKGSARSARQSSVKRSTKPQPIGFKLSETDQGNCVLVTAVTRKGPAEQAGVQKGDMLYYVNNKPTRNLQEFRHVAGNAVGNLKLSVRRPGGVKITLTIVR